MSTSGTPWLGIVADDVTGACDTAGVISALGVPTVVMVGTPEPDDVPAECGCVVVALTTRNAPPAAAVRSSLTAGRWLLGHGAERLYQKYCSTFDSTSAGNIGPVADSLADLVGGTSAGTPATPTVGRTVYQGHLFVDGRLLSESSLRHHPLNPMTDADLVRVLGAQTDRPVRLVRREVLGDGPVDSGRSQAVRDSVRDGDGGHVLLDATSEADLDILGDALLDGDELLGGASGLAAALIRRRRGNAPGEAPTASLPPIEPNTKRLVIAGSCSRRTLEQVDDFHGPVVRLDMDGLAADPDATVRTAQSAVSAELRARDTSPILVTTSLEPEQLSAVQDRHGRDRTSQLAEDALATIARFAVTEAGVRRLIVAGGETSGTVTSALGIRQVHVGAEVAPGVPWTVSVGVPALALLLKSGNFGGRDLFTTAWDRCP